MDFLHENLTPSQNAIHTYSSGRIEGARTPSSVPKRGKGFSPRLTRASKTIQQHLLTIKKKVRNKIQY